MGTRECPLRKSNDPDTRKSPYPLILCGKPEVVPTGVRETIGSGLSGSLPSTERGDAPAHRRLNTPMDWDQSLQVSLPQLIGYLVLDNRIQGGYVNATAD
jgi:hypothetical protein